MFHRYANDAVQHVFLHGLYYYIELDLVDQTLNVFLTICSSSALNIRIIAQWNCNSTRIHQSYR